MARQRLADIPLCKPWLGRPEAAAARKAILSGWVTQGEEVRAFEQEFAECVGAPYACATSSCTAALHLALLALGVGPDDEVIVPSYSFIATTNCVRYCGATPVFVDIDPCSGTIAPAQVAAAISRRSRAIICVHQMGMPCDLEALAAISRESGVPLIEDAACALGSSIAWDGQWEPIGRPRGIVACFSFHPRKVITTGEGGMLTTSDETIDQTVRMLRQHARNIDAFDIHRAGRVDQETYDRVGFNYRMTDIQAAIGRQQLKRLPRIVARRRRLARRYSSLLRDTPGLQIPREPRHARSNWQSYCVTLLESIDRHRVMTTLLERGIATKAGIMCAHREPAYASHTLNPLHRLSHSEWAQDRGVLLPLYHDLGDAEQETVARELRESVRLAARAGGSEWTP